MPAAKKPADWEPAEKTESTLTALEAVEAEVDAEDDDSVEVPLGDTTVRVKPTNEWRSSGVSAMRQGDYSAWAQVCLVEGDAEVWDEIDPTMGECEAFFRAWGEITGQTPGKSRASRRSSKSTARR
jgi:hypothetical protein